MKNDLQFFNGIGGFNEAGNEYIIYLHENQTTPAPWANVIANTKFGFICTETGGGYTWHLNSSQNKLTTWGNDPILDPSSEIIYIHNTQSGETWSCTPSPIREKELYEIHHGFGYSTYEHSSHGVEQELIQFVCETDPVKISILKLKNMTDSPMDISTAYYLRPVLGTDIHQTEPYIVTSYDSKLNSVYIKNVYSTDFKDMTSFLCCANSSMPSYTGDRTEFLGVKADISNPIGMCRKLCNTTGAGLNPCAAIKSELKILPGEEQQIIFLFGEERSIDEVNSLINKYNSISSVNSELERVRGRWVKNLGSIQVSTPDKSMSILLNGWMQYQVLSCRLWARSGFYQAGGAFGFRDQLQDSMALIYSQPELTKNQIMLHCRHQFIEGDVQHWWHEQKMNGIRTRYSDDLLWLPYVTCDYIKITGDWSILTEKENYIESPILAEGEHERYEIPNVSSVSEGVYEHCIKAIDHSLRFGIHGIPLIGGGDWNDGMNLIGAKGRGESVWLGWFLHCVLKSMLPICRYMKDNGKASIYEAYSTQIIEAIEKEAWDGSWYRRAYFDDGTPLGSIQNSEGKIDSLAQSWAAISGVARPKRVEEAMNALEKYLVDRKNGLIKLLTPPFYDGDLNPGYIKGYLPGVRENGGQYTHAATWVIYAFTKLGNGDRACELFNMINPINHARTQIECITYKVEPYVMAADVYSVYPNEGRGGWTWYTGAAGWMYRVGIEHILGIKKHGNTLTLDPCIPKNWDGFECKYIFDTTSYQIKVNNNAHLCSGISSVTVDGQKLSETSIQLIGDGKEHQVEIVMG